MRSFWRGGLLDRLPPLQEALHAVGRRRCGSSAPGPVGVEKLAAWLVDALAGVPTDSPGIIVLPLSRAGVEDPK